MRFPALPILFLVSVTTVLAQDPQPNQAAGNRTSAGSATSAPQAEQKSADANGVDTIIELVKAKVSEALVLKTIQRQNKPYDLTPDDLVKLQKAGVSETIVNAMLDPSAASAASPVSAPARAPAAAPSAPPAAAPGAAPVAPAAGSASKVTSGSPPSSAGCPQPPSTAASTPSQQETKGGAFSSFKNKLKASAQKTVDGLGDTVNCAADKGVQDSQTQVSSAMDKAVAAPAEKVSDIGSTGNKTANSDKASATGGANAAKTPGKKSPQK